MRSNNMGMLFLVLALLALTSPVLSGIGDTCTDGGNECDSTNHEECTGTAGSKTCTCETSQTCTDPCLPDPCNGETCASDGKSPAGADCTCANGKGGTHCEEAPKCTSDTECHDKGTCQQPANQQFVCNCNAGYGGDTCGDTPKCTTDQDCNDHGTCTIVAGKQSVCDCSPVWEGEKCQTAKTTNTDTKESTTDTTNATALATTTPSKGTRLPQADGLLILLVLFVLMKMLM